MRASRLVDVAIMFDRGDVEMQGKLSRRQVRDNTEPHEQRNDGRRKDITVVGHHGGRAGLPVHVRMERTFVAEILLYGGVAGKQRGRRHPSRFQRACSGPNLGPVCRLRSQRRAKPGAGRSFPVAASRALFMFPIQIRPRSSGRFPPRPSTHTRRAGARSSSIRRLNRGLWDWDIKIKGLIANLARGRSYGLDDATFMLC